MMTLLTLCLKRTSSRGYDKQYDLTRLLAIKTVLYTSAITETTDLCLDLLFQMCATSNDNIVELCQDKHFLARLINIVSTPLLSEDMEVIGAKSKALILFRLFLQREHALSAEVKKEIAINSDSILSCLSIPKKSIESEEIRDYQVIQFYRTVSIIMELLTAKNEDLQLTLFHDETIGKIWAKAIVICVEMSLSQYSQQLLSRRVFLQMANSSVKVLLRCCSIPELNTVVCAEDDVVAILFNLMVMLKFDNDLCKNICRIFDKMFRIIDPPTEYWAARREFFDERYSNRNY